ncbi:MAG: hypothetical protein NC122_05940 [Faecalibacterium sp.]|nr:hypothetical protein [Ruminococcus sp.]MCM1392010.1 hypothetical protein [Ruminococcus sp.]MCM1485730.1 hypothetical protein [Faecalibacterium sp.]
MRKSIKKTISILLSIIMIFSVSAVAFAAEESVTPVIVVSGMGSRPLYGEDGEAVFPMQSETIIKSVAEMVFPLTGSIAMDNWEIFAKYGVEPIHALFADLACDENGDSVKKISPTVYPESSGNYEVFTDVKDDETAETAMVRTIADKIGYDDTYFFNYDWRFNPMMLADELEEMIAKVKAERNCDKVSLVGMSFGGMIISSYIYKYGTDSIKNMVYASTAFNGVELVGQLFAGNIEIELGAALNYLTSFTQGIEFLSSILGVSTKVLETYGIKGKQAVNDYLKRVIDVLSYPAYTEVFGDTFGAFQGMWCLMPIEYYESSKQFMSETIELSDSFYAEVEDYLYNVQDNTQELISKAEDNGVNVYIVGAYGYSGIPVSAGSANHTDNLIDTYLMTGNSIVAPYGKTLNDVDYSNDGFCTEHNHVSTDNVIDAGGCFLPEQTWFIKNMRHVEYMVNTRSANLVAWLASSDEKVDVHTSESYPQFMELTVSSGEYKSLTDGVNLDGEDVKTDFLSVFKALIKNIINAILKFLNLGLVL